MEEQHDGNEKNVPRNVLQIRIRPSTSVLLQNFGTLLPIVQKEKDGVLLRNVLRLIGPMLGPIQGMFFPKLQCWEEAGMRDRRQAVVVMPEEWTPLPGTKRFMGVETLVVVVVVPMVGKQQIAAQGRQR